MSVPADSATATRAGGPGSEVADWTRRATDVAANILGAARAGRPQRTYCGAFPVELYAAEVLPETVTGVAPGTVVGYDGLAFSIAAGDGGIVRVTSSATSFDVSRTPYIEEVIRGAAMEEPVVLVARPHAPPTLPYWERAARVARRTTTRSLILYCGGPAEDALEAVSRTRLAGRDAVLVDVSGEGGLEARYPWLDVRRLDDYGAAGPVRSARRTAADWLQSVSRRRLTVSSRSILETLQDSGVPRWWRFEISLQERAFLVIRLVETLREILRIEKTRSVTIVGGVDGHWLTTTVLETCRAANVDVTRIGSGPSEPPPRDRYDRRWIWIPTSGSFLARFARPLVTKLATIVFGLPILILVLVLASAAVTLLPVTVAVIVSLYLLSPLLRPRLNGRRARVAIGRLSRPARGLAIAMVVWAILIFLLWSNPLQVLLGAATVAIAAFALYVLFVLEAPSYLGLTQTLRWPWHRAREIRSSLRPRAIVRALIRRPVPKSASRSDSRKVHVALLIDEGNIRARRSVGVHGSGPYNPYFEGIEAAFRSASGTSVTVLSYGDAPGSRTMAGRIAQLRRSVRPRGGRIALRSYLNERDFERADLARASRQRELAILRNDAGLRAAWRYADIDLWPAMADVFETMFDLAAYAEPYDRALGRIVDLIHPDVVVTYNYEGVFRRLLPAVIRRGIPVLGVQQALGPYVHALGPSPSGRDRALAREPLGVPMPDRIAVWGERDVQLLRQYGHDGGSIVRTGYARSDTFIREHVVKRERVLRRLRVPADARVIVYSAVLRVLDGPLLSDDRWRDSLAAVLRASADARDVEVVVKPWPGDDTERIRFLMDSVADEHVHYADPAIDLHNAELLGVAEAVVGTFSSFLAEAVLAGAVPVLLDFPEARYYFTDEVEAYRSISLKASSPRRAGAIVRTILAGGQTYREDFRRAAIGDLQRIFGPLDGHAADRIVSAALDLARETR